MLSLASPSRPCPVYELTVVLNFRAVVTGSQVARVPSGFYFPVV